MDYKQSVAYIESLMPTITRPGLERFQDFMQEHANLQNKVASLHVAGTNGKGSVASMLAETLNLSGLKTGKYTGPHLIHYNERFELAGSCIDSDEFARICSLLRAESEAFAVSRPEHGALTWYELLTAIAFFYFFENAAQANVIEVGLGGQYDASNVLSLPQCTAITNVSLDHTHILGDTVSKIAFEKAGIIKPGVPVVTAAEGEALEQIIERARLLQAPGFWIKPDLTVENLNCARNESRILDYINSRLWEPSLQIQEVVFRQKGFQRMNALLAAVVLAIFEQKQNHECLSSFSKALNTYFWPGRLQHIKKHNLVLDGAHNPSGAAALEAVLCRCFPGLKRNYLLAFYKSKEFKQILPLLLRKGDRVVCSQAEGRRAVVPASEIAELASQLGCEAELSPDLASGFARAQALTRANEILICTGSFAVVAAALKALGYQSVYDSKNDSERL